jgi:hypothetical protein
MRKTIFTIMSFFVGLTLALGQERDLLSGVPIVNDINNYPSTLIARPEVGQAVVDPEFGIRIVRITDAATAESRSIVPMYSNTHAWNVDESYMILYEPGATHRAYLGQPPYTFLGSFQWPMAQDGPTDLENIHWSGTDPNIYRFPSLRGQLIEISIVPLEWRVLHDFSDLCGNEKLLMETHGRPSWDDRYWGFSCVRVQDETKLIFVYDLEEDSILWQYRIQLPERWIESTPRPSATGEFFVVQYQDGLYVFDRAGIVVGAFGVIDGNDFLLQGPEHSTIGLAKVNGVEYDMFFTTNFDPPVPNEASLLGYFISFPYIAYEYIGTQRNYPYPPSGIHHSGLAANWIWTSIKGTQNDGQSLLDNEVTLTSILDARVGRIVHHRSLVNNYWAEPHITASPSGTRAIFGSNWMVGFLPGTYDTIETYVIELPIYGVSEDLPEE